MLSNWKRFLFISSLLVLMQHGCNLPPTNEVTKQTLEIKPTYTLFEHSEINSTDEKLLENTTVPEPTNTVYVEKIPELIKAGRLAVVFINEGDTLAIYSEPNDEQVPIKQLDPNQTNLIPNGEYQWLNDKLWLKISFAGGMGWTNSGYLTEQVETNQFCNDTRVLSLLDQFRSAIQDRDGMQFFQLISPLHGFNIRHEWWNPQIRIINSDILSNIFIDQTNYAWGIYDGSGLDIKGSFQEIILPSLDDVISNASIHCNILEPGLSAGGSTGFIKWPFEYANFNYYSLYRAASPGDDLNWRTWAIGVEYVGNIPYIVAIVQYHWEI